MIAHQWRQPLSVVSTLVGTIQIHLELKKFDLTTEDGIEKHNKLIQDKLEDIDNTIQNLSETIDDFRNFYKPNKKAVTIKLEEVVSKSLSVIGTLLLNNNIEIIKEYNSKEEMKVYDNELIQVILNILKNAQDNFKEKHTKDAYIKITTANRSVSISDNGGGVPEDIIEKIFDPYFSTRDEKNGTGLGLYMSKIIVEEHHSGKLRVYNTEDGACFVIEI